MITANTQMQCCFLIVLALLRPLSCPGQPSMVRGSPHQPPSNLDAGGGTSCRACPCMQDMHTLESRQTARLQCEYVPALLLARVRRSSQLLCDHLLSTECLCCSQSGARHTIKEAVLCTAGSCPFHFTRLLLDLSSNRGLAEHHIPTRLPASDGISGSAPAYCSTARSLHNRQYKGVLPLPASMCI